MQLLTIVSFVSKLLSNPELQSLAIQFIAWLKTLTPAQQLAYASKFDAFQGFGCSHGDDCPDCPEELVEVEAELFAAVKGE